MNKYHSMDLDLCANKKGLEKTRIHPHQYQIITRYPGALMENFFSSGAPHIHILPQFCNFITTYCLSVKILDSAIIVSFTRT